MKREEEGYLFAGGNSGNAVTCSIYRRKTVTNQHMRLMMRVTARQLKIPTGEPVLSDDTLLRVRRAIMRLVERGNGHVVRFLLNSARPEPAHEEAVAFARKKRIGIRVTTDADSLVITRDDAYIGGKYGPVDDLAVDQSYVFEVAPRQHQGIRVNVSARTRQTGKRYTCRVVPGGIEVTRIAEDAPRLCGRKPGAVKYDLDPLLEHGRVSFSATAKIVAVRLAAAATARAHGWDLYTRWNDDGTITVFRLDHLREAPAAVDAEPVASAS